MSDSFADVFYNVTGLQFSNFVMYRDVLFKIVVNKPGQYYGFGSVSSYLETIDNGLNLHNDLLMIYFDCGLLGVFIFVISLTFLCENNYFSFFIMIYIMFQLLTAHFLGRGSFMFLTSFYMIILYFNGIYEFKVSKEKKFSLIAYT